ncbi:MAG TPA: CDP-alcohol phosphatidyltransferase family protein [Bacteroidota bacterium]|nr:CDP-alcohol phosphatidyltransferase family protein [Bacteroidota bacterium]
MQLLEQYKASLKSIESEEVFDLVIYRPLAFLFVKATYSTSLTPNQVSVMAMVIGVVGGVFFGCGTPVCLTLGAVCYFLSNVLDCADGQIARLKHNGSRIGRIVDGFIDYVVSIAVFLGIAISLTKSVDAGIIPEFGARALGITPESGYGVLYVWVLTILAGASTALQAFHFDLRRNNYLKFVYGKAANLEDEIRDYEEEHLRALKKRGIGKYIDLLLIRIYLGYCRLQMKSQSGKPALQPVVVPPEIFSRHNKTLLRAWSYIGSTTHITVCVACALAGNLEAFLLITLVPLNALLGALLLLQGRADRTVNESSILIDPVNT